MVGKKLPAVFYSSETGDEPVRTWLKSLDPEERKCIGKDIGTVEFGFPVGMPVCRQMGDGLYEVRTDLPTNKIARVLFCVYKKQMFLLHGFIKKDQKTPKKDLDLASKRKRQLESRK